MAVSLANRVKKSIQKSPEEVAKREKLHDRFVHEVQSMRGKTIHLVVFSLSGEQFAIEISKVREVVKTPEITRMPKTPTYIPGIGKVRGTGVIMLDLAAKLGLAEVESLPERNDYTIVVSSGRFTIGIVVPTVPLSKKINGDLIQPTGLDLAGTPEDETYIKGLIHEGDQQIFFIDIDELIEGDRMSSRVTNKP